ncbi:hypothetical protein Hypma_013598 [Hypsizygus marmoreus]|uniref:F-box domain-containing protein n=1 Tax=Hypsizygus marmoreus TaxID=39966 RepID=A0A369JDL3_HYPMA|nr:hypothetical protein Hypma_013598 [Hypsizygus marmoreus]
MSSASTTEEDRDGLSSTGSESESLTAPSEATDAVAFPMLIEEFPSEILSELFLFSCDLADYPLKDPLRLQGVCFRWLNVVVNDPRFWKVLKIITSDINTEDGTAHTWERLDRSRELPLTLSVTLPVFPVFDNCTVPRDILSRSVRRLQQLTLRLHWTFFPDIANIDFSQSVYLKSFEIHINSTETETSTNPINSVLDFYQCPELYVAKVHFAFKIPNFSLRVVFPRVLTELYLYDETLSGKEVNCVLRQCVNLKKCDIRVDLCNVPPENIIVPPPVTHMQLSSMALLHRPFSLVPIFEDLTFPALERLELVYEGFSHETWAPSILALQERSAFPLTVLTFEGLPIDDDVPLLLSLLPALESLDILRCTGLNIVVDALTVSDDASVLLPALNDLHISQHFGELEDDPDPLLVIAMIQSRWWSDAPREYYGPERTARLQKVTYNPEQMTTAELEEWTAAMITLRNEGLQLEFEPEMIKESDEGESEEEESDGVESEDEESDDGEFDEEESDSDVPGEFDEGSELDTSGTEGQESEEESEESG